MSRPIKEGDIVDVCWQDDSILKAAEILHMPADTGDLMYVKFNDNIYGVNTSATAFDCIVKKPTA